MRGRDHYFGEDKEKRLSDDLIMISQLYSMLREDFKSLLQFCEDNDLDFYTDGFNTRQPGRAFRVVIYKLKPGGKFLSRRDYREKVIRALQTFYELSTDSEGKAQAVERKVLVQQLMKTGMFSDEIDATKVLRTLEKGGQIQKSRILD